MRSSLTVGVVNEKVYGSASLRPLTAVADVSTVTSYSVANGNGGFGFGVKIRRVVPDHRNVPAIAGAIRTNGARTTAGMRPRVTIGSEKTMRISFASARLSISPSGPALTIVRSGLPGGACAPD